MKNYSMFINEKKWQQSCDKNNNVSKERMMRFDCSTILNP